MPKVSIIVPVYNTEKYLEKCLNSLVNQTLADIQIIIVNDGSKDNSYKIANKYKQDYPDKILYLEKENGGLGDARNYAIPYATGEYIGFVDSDDYVELNMYENMYHTAKQENSDMVECDFYWEYPNKVKKDIGTNYTNKQDYFINGRVMACNKLYKTSLIKNNNIKFSTGLLYEDIEFFYSIVAYLTKTSFINKSFYHYLQRNNSIINKQTEKAADIFIILNNIICFYKENNLYEKYLTELEYLNIRLLLGSSFLRIIKIKDKKIKNNLLNKTWNYLNSNFPNWKKNSILKNFKSKKNLFYKTINRNTFFIYSKILKITRR